MPPEPERVTRRISPSSRRTSASSRSRPRKRVSCSGRLWRAADGAAPAAPSIHNRARHDAIAAALFRQVRRFVGELHHVHRIDVRHGGHRSNAHADRHAAQRRSVVGRCASLRRGAHALGHDDRVLQVGRRQNGGKLFAAVACEHVVRALHARAKRLRDLLQACIARNVPVAVVECFEVIDRRRTRSQARSWPGRSASIR